MQHLTCQPEGTGVAFQIEGKESEGNHYRIQSHG